LIQEIEQARRQLSLATKAEDKSLLGQFLTPGTTAQFMANLFVNGRGACRLLDAGAGIGSLSAAFMERWKNGGFDFSRVEVDAFELDDRLIPHLRKTLNGFHTLAETSSHLYEGDFIETAVRSLTGDIFADHTIEHYSHAILNPPYKKIKSDSQHRRWLREAGIETVNLYSGFVALALALSAKGGQIVAIIPRSFCNGPYYKPFREFILQHAAIHHIHLFKSRTKAFKDDAVLQENVIIHLERGGEQGLVKVSTSSDDTFVDLETYEHPFDRIVFQSDSERFIHVPTSPGTNGADQLPAIRWRLDDLGIKVSTGPVVDFRLKEHLREMPGAGTVPLLYPAHFKNFEIRWPLKGMKKPNALELNAMTRKWLYPNGYYCVVRRFSSKEEKRRIVASIVEPTAFGEAQMLGFENHLNLFHENKRGLPETLARGLMVFLNSSPVDDSFRRFNGHTQVNATDLKLMMFPSRENLVRLGKWAMRKQVLTQHEIDAQVRSLS
jgi:adenine-specific DNA-methyltransferase